jgi:4'-phosphopantetheinyl transferase
VLAAAEVYAWWAHTDDLTDAHHALLDPRERERWARHRRQEDRDRFTLGSAVVRTLVAELDGTVPSLVDLDRACQTCGAQHGPVTTPGRGWRCSVSHSGSFAVAAAVASTTAGHLGVDLETTCPPDWRILLPDVLAPDEVAPRHEQGFLTLWVRKEAVLKATGEGLSRPMSSVCLADGSGSGDAPRVVGGAPPLQLVDLDVRPLRAAQTGGSAAAPMAAALAVDAERVTVQWRRASIRPEGSERA